MLDLLLAATLQIADMARIVDLEEPAIAPDARRVAVVVITADAARTAYVNRLLLVDARTGRTSVLVRGRDVAVPRWSPDGTRLAYWRVPRPPPPTSSLCADPTVERFS